MNQRERLLQVVAEDLQQDGNDYFDLKGLMEALYGQLLERDVAAIERTNEEIAARVEVLSLRAQRRSKVLAAFGLGAGADDMARLLGAYPADRRPQVAVDWARLGDLAAQCQALNERNGRLLAMHHEILAQLTGRAAAVYAPS